MSDGTVITGLPLTDLVAKIRSKEVKPSEATAAYLERIAAVDGKVGAYLAIDAEGARAAARLLDEKQAKGQDLGSLGGAPLAGRGRHFVERNGFLSRCGRGQRI